ncbi:ribosomal protein S18-alanine N-acetyltransferase [Cetobacterium sp. 8H]|uniref:ribosomal protein S18-alanine N-acetyltransferase n=1 Tax=Cetobacterium sp. 8H TaxID=2759681 RepID=UPI00163C3DC2|nr:ribosomal protein S18-alanine N-acetyltransferase [Cetobacterium sp. 8H]MBC2850637.1 ribosomal protein S18-alanine N-acetyltransferase [Cetobacterium sp. 8H]
MQVERLKELDVLVIEELAELEKEIFHESYYSIDTLKDMVKSKEYKIFIIKQEVIQGYLILHDSYDVFEIMKIAVREEFRKRGIAGKLIQTYFTLEEKNLLLEVRESNIIAQKFYKKLKFEVIGKRKNYYPNGETAILMLLEIN